VCDGRVSELGRDLVPRLRRWPPASWTVRVGPTTRAEVVHAAVQRLADLGADLEGRPRRPVPRLADPTLADQLAVVVDDLLRLGDPAAERAVRDELTALRPTLGLR
jgi:hypothetical protein